MIGARFPLAVYQFAPDLAQPEANARRIAEAATRAGAELIVAPELSLTGYDVGADARRLALRLGAGPDHDPLPPGLEEIPGAILGLIERGDDGTPYNVAVHVRAGAVVFRHRKLYLPTYGMFDEGRYFGRGGRVDAFELGGGWRAGLLVCEDLWHPALAYLLAMRGIHALFVLAAAPGRGVWEGGSQGGVFASSDAWERIARTTAQLYGIYVVLANRVGAEGGVVFGGRSLVVAPSGEVAARAPDDAESILTAELALEEVRRARHPFAHARDDDPHLLLRELRRLVEDGP